MQLHQCIPHTAILTAHESVEPSAAGCGGVGFGRAARDATPFSIVHPLLAGGARVPTCSRSCSRRASVQSPPRREGIARRAWRQGGEAWRPQPHLYRCPHRSLVTPCHARHRAALRAPPAAGPPPTLKFSRAENRSCRRGGGARCARHSRQTTSDGAAGSAAPRWARGPGAERKVGARRRALPLATGSCGLSRLVVRGGSRRTVDEATAQ
eukprot:168655-Chlamydomonas_euryale.AAC.11